MAVGTTKKVDRCQAIGVICKEYPPRLRWWLGVTDHVFRDGGLGDGKAKGPRIHTIPHHPGHSFDLFAGEPKPKMVLAPPSKNISPQNSVGVGSSLMPLLRGDNEQHGW